MPSASSLEAAVCARKGGAVFEVVLRELRYARCEACLLVRFRPELAFIPVGTGWALRKSWLVSGTLFGTGS